jgi:predicted PurR-regulated permease PerM
MTKKFILPPMWAWLLVFSAFALIFWSVQGIITPFFVSFIIAYMLNPLIVKLEPYKINRTFSAFVIVIGFFALIILAIFISIPFLKSELLKLAYSLPRYIERIYSLLSPYFDTAKELLNIAGKSSFDETVAKNISRMAAWLLEIAAGLFTNTLALANMISLIVLTPIISFYLLRDWQKTVASFYSLVPPKYFDRVNGLLYRINIVLGGYFRGQAIVCLSLFCYYAIFLGAVGLNFSLTIASITGFFAFIPYIGYLIGFSAGIGVAMSQFQDWSDIGIVLVIFLVGQIIESYYLLPKMVGDRICLHPVWIIFSLLSGGLLMGFTGLLIAMPIAATIGVLIRSLVQEYRSSTYYAS